MVETDYAGHVDSYLCENHDVLESELTSDMRGCLQGERPLTSGDRDRWIETIDFHLEARLEKNGNS